MTVPYCVIDAFTAEPFRGNPAAVCWLERPRDAAWMQAVAAEMNLSETAFLEPAEEGFGLRWFTPTLEVPLCGHATLASAHFLYATERLARREPARFHTQSGVLTARAEGRRIALDFPAFDSLAADPPARLVAAVAVRPVAARRVDRPGTDSIWIFELESEAAVRAATPDFKAMIAAAVDPVIVTARAATSGFDFVSRFFGPGHGIDEDPVTGSAHCMLGPYWRAQLGKDTFNALQVSQRIGSMEVRLERDRALLIGDAALVSEGVLRA